MRQDKLTSKFQLALSDAQSLAVARDHQFIEPAHLLMALLDQQGGTVRPLLDKAGVNLNQLRSRLGLHGQRPRPLAGRHLRAGAAQAVGARHRGGERWRGLHVH